MYEQFYRPSRTKIRRDSQGVARDIIHEHHFVSRARSARLAAREYLGKFRDLIGPKAEELGNLNRRVESKPTDAGIEYRFHAEKPQFDATTVAYYQTIFGLPIWEAGLAAHLTQEPFRIIGTQTTRHSNIQIGKPSARAIARLKKLNAETLGKLLGIAGNRDFHAKSLRVLRRRLMVYRYEKSKRVVRPERRKGKTHKNRPSIIPCCGCRRLRVK